MDLNLLIGKSNASIFRVGVGNSKFISNFHTVHSMN
jgi:hypothetical protein